QADRFGIAHFAEAFDDARGFQAESVVWQRLGQHKLSRLGAGGLRMRNCPFGFGAPVGWDDTPIRMARPENAQNSGWGLTEPIDRAALIFARTHWTQPRENPITRRQTWLTWFFRHH